MKSIFILSIVAVFGTVSFFPKPPFGADAEVSRLYKEWYSSQLKALEEPPLIGRSQAKTQYRFTWLRSSDRPIAMRIDVMKNRNAYFILKIADGRGGYDPGKLVRSERWKLSRQQLEAFESVFSTTQFQQLPVTTEANGLDGAQWLVEVNSDGVYHLCVRWSPKEGPIREIGMAFIKLATADFASIY